MDTPTFIARILDAIAWPIAATAIALIFRNEIKTLLGRLTKGKFGSAEFEFDKDTQALKDVIYEEFKENAIAMPAPNTGRLRPSSTPKIDVISTWTEIEDLARQVALNKNVIDSFNAKNPSRVIRALEKRRALGPPFITLFHELRALRNQAVHDIAFRPSPESISGYLDMAEILKQKLRSALRECS